ncbi:hypothetical protein MBLNU13_g10318t4 [Cladosporium sp. NU13]
MAKCEVAKHHPTTTVHDADTYGNAAETTFTKQEFGRAKKSYIWQAGVGSAVTEVKSGKKFWLCRHCYDNPVPQPLFLVETDSTTPVIRHLHSRHNYDDKGRWHEASGQKRKRDTKDIRDALKRLRDEKEVALDSVEWKRAYLRWIVMCNQSLRSATSPALRDLLSLDHSRIDSLILASHSTAHRYIVDDYTSPKAHIAQALAKARNSIPISFDTWLADNQLDMLGVTAHYLDEQLRVKTVLLGLRPIDLVGYFVADNASNNDTALREMAKEIDIDSLRQRIRCNAHVLNLVAKAILYGTGSDCIADAAKVASQLNSAVCTNASPTNGGIRWNSDLEMIKRALKLRDALQLYQDHYFIDEADTLEQEDCLSTDYWIELTELKELLQPIKDVSVRYQTVPVDGSHGALWQTLSTTEWLLAKFEDLKRQPLSQYFLACVNLG